MFKKSNAALECLKSITVHRLIKELSRLPLTHKIALIVNGRPYALNRGAILRLKDGNFLMVKSRDKAQPKKSRYAKTR